MSRKNSSLQCVCVIYSKNSTILQLALFKCSDDTGVPNISPNSTSMKGMIN